MAEAPYRFIDAAIPTPTRPRRRSVVDLAVGAPAEVALCTGQTARVGDEARPAAAGANAFGLFLQRALSKAAVPCDS